MKIERHGKREIERERENVDWKKLERLSAARHVDNFFYLKTSR